MTLFRRKLVLYLLGTFIGAPISGLFMQVLVWAVGYQSAAAFRTYGLTIAVSALVAAASLPFAVWLWREGAARLALLSLVSAVTVFGSVFVTVAASRASSGYSMSSAIDDVIIWCPVAPFGSLIAHGILSRWRGGVLLT